MMDKKQLYINALNDLTNEGNKLQYKLNFSNINDSNNIEFKNWEAYCDRIIGIVTSNFPGKTLEYYNFKIKKFNTPISKKLLEYLYFIQELKLYILYNSKL